LNFKAIPGIRPNNGRDPALSFNNSSDPEPLLVSQTQVEQPRAPSAVFRRRLYGSAFIPFKLFKFDFFKPNMAWRCPCLPMVFFPS
jgi:hypothetical protein